MKQKFVHHPLRPNPPRAQAASAKLVVSEYVAYVAALSIGVVVAIITFAYAANITIQWLRTMSGPNYFSSQAQPVSHPNEKISAPTKFALVAGAESPGTK
ncbi:hypothetical protein [Hyphomicrobium sp.]|uniref:hypothetical protein n=1 Tax=Hyphomicrobium sp. TaxID=82 RepID=UPI002D7712A2|nr:hypothetical protein [Hyphomicrobium sp.]HET6389695.1 hypothetical protein [Hyphomicrobium sp.]